MCTVKGLSEFSALKPAIFARNPESTEWGRGLFRGLALKSSQFFQVSALSACSYNRSNGFATPQSNRLLSGFALHADYVVLSLTFIS